MARSQPAALAMWAMSPAAGPGVGRQAWSRQGWVLWFDQGYSLTPLLVSLFGSLAPVRQGHWMPYHLCPQLY